MQVAVEQEMEVIHSFFPIQIHLQKEEAPQPVAKHKKVVLLQQMFTMQIQSDTPKAAKNNLSCAAASMRYAVLCLVKWFRGGITQSRCP